MNKNTNLDLKGELINPEENSDSKKEEENVISDNELIEASQDEIFSDETQESENTEQEVEGDEAKIPTPVNMLPDNIKSYKIPHVRKSAKFDDDCSGDETYEEDDVGDDFFQNENGVRKKNDSNLTSKRVLAFFMIFPMLVTGGVMLYGAVAKYTFQRSAMQLTATIGGAAVALYFISRVAALKSAVKVVLCFAWIIFLIPTYQVYKCSPIELKNEMLGTWFSLKTNSVKFLESSYVTSICFRSFQFHTPYMLSVISPKIVLTVNVNNMVNLNLANEIPDDEEASKVLNYFLFVSKRSVKRKFHKLYLLVEASSKHAKFLKDSLSLNTKEKEKYLLKITGTVEEIDDTLRPMKEELESIDYLIRPMKFKVYRAEYKNRYVKFH